MSSGSRPISLRDEARGHIEFVLGTAAGSLWWLSEREFWPYRGAGACEGHFSAVNRESAGGSCLKILKIKRCRGKLSENSRRCFAENAPPKSQNQDLTSYKFCGRPRKTSPVIFQPRGRLSIKKIKITISKTMDIMYVINSLISPRFFAVNFCSNIANYIVHPIFKIIDI